MSNAHICRHNLKTEGHEIATVGWDAPQNTYFLQVGPEDPFHSGEIEEPKVWLGISMGEIGTVEDLEQKARTEGLEIDSELQEHLDAYRLERSYESFDKDRSPVMRDLSRRVNDGDWGR